MKTEAFVKAYNGLNSAQREAVDTIEGPVMVVAGPGTGKTQILTLRIANIIAKTDTAPENILALTFTEAATGNMRRRLADVIGNPAYRVVINTFHGFCNDIIRRYPEDFPRIIGSRSITEVDQVSIIESIIDQESFLLLKPFGDRFLYVRDIVSAIGDMKREGVSPERFLALIQTEQSEFEEIPDLYHEKGAHTGKMKGDYQKLERKIMKNAELARAYQLYQAKLTQEKQYDFNDMILEVLGALQTNPSLLQMLQEEHQYVLVDEHQDTNNAQNKILELLMNFHPNPNLFVVGDEKQAIFRFQGASLENFYYFKTLYPSARLVTLAENYRSTQSILDNAESLISGKAALQKRATHSEHPIHTAEFATTSSERYFIAHDIKGKIDKGIAPEEITILYRNNRDAFPIARDLDRVGVPYSIESDQDLFSHGDVQKLLVILRGIAEYGNDIHLAPILHIPQFGIDPLDSYRLLRYANEKKKSVFVVLTSEDLLTDAGLANLSALSDLSAKLTRWVRESHDIDILSFFEKIVRESGLLEQVLSSGDALDRLDAVNALFDEVKKLVELRPAAKLPDFFAYLETVKKHNLFLKRKSGGALGGRVRLMTVHRSKGLEFSHVYIMNVVHGVFGGKVDRDRLPLIDSVYKLTQ